MHPRKLHVERWQTAQKGSIAGAHHHSWGLCSKVWSSLLRLGVVRLLRLETAVVWGGDCTCAVCVTCACVLSVAIITMSSPKNTVPQHLNDYCIKLPWTPLSNSDMFCRHAEHDINYQGTTSMPLWKSWTHALCYIHQNRESLLVAPRSSILGESCTKHICRLMRGC